MGWWLGQLWIAAAWALFVSIIRIPFGVILLNKLPQVIALRRTETPLVVSQTPDGATVVSAGVQQHNIVPRAAWSIFIGWWFSGLWMETAYFSCATIVGLPLGFWMFDRTPAIVSLRRD